MNILHKSDRGWQIQLISPTRRLLTLILRNQTLLLFNLNIQMCQVCRKSSKTWNQNLARTMKTISSQLLRQVGDIVAYPLCIIKNQSLCTGIFPNRLKLAKVIPLYKKDDSKLLGNYRPISLLSSLSKVFEKIVFDQLYDYLITKGLLFESQYGFRKQHSTELAALELTDPIRREMDQNRVPFSVFLELSKAFDTLNHHILLSKLEYYGIRSSALQWFKSYLTERQQFVEYQNRCSSTKELETGVPRISLKTFVVSDICERYTYYE